MNFLIVEDEFISRTLLKEILEPYGECRVAGNGKEAITALQESMADPEKKFDLVCLDIMMPEMDGQQVLKEIRKLEQDNGVEGTRATKVVMITALDDAKNIMEALVVGKCQAYLTKPVSRMRLEEQLRHLHLIEGTSN